MGEEDKHVHKDVIGWLLLLMVVAIILSIHSIRVENKFGEIEQQLEDMPKRVCEMEEGSVRKVEWPYVGEGKTAFGGKSINAYWVGRDEEVVCEEGITIDYKSTNPHVESMAYLLIYKGNESKTCLIKTVEEKCEIK